jgi:hypothetical protein
MALPGRLKLAGAERAAVAVGTLLVAAPLPFTAVSLRAEAGTVDLARPTRELGWLVVAVAALRVDTAVRAVEAVAREVIEDAEDAEDVDETLPAWLIAPALPCTAETGRARAATLAGAAVGPVL